MNRFREKNILLTNQKLDLMEQAMKGDISIENYRTRLNELYQKMNILNSNIDQEIYTRRTKQ
jgi:hypothetical protein